MYVRSLFALICSAVIGSATALSLDFNPAKFIIDDTSAGKGFGCKLNEKPTSPVTIYLEHTSIYFSDCILVFTPENWDILQTINATAVPVFGSYMGAGGIADIASSINAHMVQEGQTTEIPKVEYGCDRKPAAGGTCTSIGDPHYQTFDSLTFSSQVIGHYYLLKSDDFEIQVITHSCGPNVSCTAAIAIRYGSTLMVLDVRQKKDPSQYTVQQVTPNTNGVVYIPPPTGSGVHKINTPCGSSISAVSNLDRGFNNIDITINLAGRYSKIGGLCNVLSSQTKKGLIYSSGKIGNPTSTQDVSGFVDSWVVKSGDSLFEGNYKGSTPPVNTPGKICKLPTIPKPVPAPPAPSVPPTLPVYVPPPPPPAPASTAAASTAPASTAAASTAAASTIVLSSTSLPGSTATSAVPLHKPHLLLLHKPLFLLHHPCSIRKSRSTAETCSTFHLATPSFPSTSLFSLVLKMPNLLDLTSLLKVASALISLVVPHSPCIWRMDPLLLLSSKVKRFKRIVDLVTAPVSITALETVSAPTLVVPARLALPAKIAPWTCPRSLNTIPMLANIRLMSMSM
ncbi:hypothetical protein O5D80_002200 [Batrachochytrium dendrobatidis]|nr:hypothetical protein O5D80_002200 [Batrachochytrium dendrobatidis]